MGDTVLLLGSGVIVASCGCAGATGRPGPVPAGFEIEQRTHEATRFAERHSE